MKPPIIVAARLKLFGYWKKYVPRT